MQKKILAVASGLVLIATPVFAADLPTKSPPLPPTAIPVFDWTGFYIGVNGGGGFGSSCWTFEGFDPPLGPVQNDGCHRPRGGLFGGQDGFNWQTGTLFWAWKRKEIGPV